MDTDQLQQNTICVGAFKTLAEADNAIQRLLTSGFERDQITVMCSDPVKRHHFDNVPQEQLPGPTATASAATGSVVGALLGGATAIAGLATAGGALVVVGGGALAAGIGGVLGGFIAAMMDRGMHKDLADYYDQAVTRGQILVAVEDHSDNHISSMARAKEIFVLAGAVPVSMPESVEDPVPEHQGT